jgi:hypothetical protein
MRHAALRWPTVSTIRVVCLRLSFVAASLFVATQFCAGSASAAGLLDGNEDFKRLAWLGFEQAIDGAHPQGTRKNDYAWSMAWFKGKLYVGTGTFELDPATGQPGAGQIWAYTPGGSDGATGTWALAYQSPGFFGGGARELGYRWMTSCNFRGTEYLFISTLGTLQGNILFTEDGVNFSTVSRTGIPFQSVGFRSMVCFTEASGRRMLITTPVGKAGDVSTFDSDESDNPIALTNDDPTGRGVWRNYSPLRMNDPDNNSFFSMTAAGGWLYAGVFNLVTGAQLWRTQGCTNSRLNCVPNWTRLIDRGGGRPRTASGLVGNQGFSDIVAYGNDLYLALSAPALDGDRVRAELWRMRADATFEVLVGEPRLNFGSSPNAPPTNPDLPASLRCGLPLEDIDGIGGANDCPPSSRRGAGFGFISDAAGGYPTGSQFYFWRLFDYSYQATSAPLGDNRLYIGTLQGVGGGQNTPGFDVLATTNGVDFVTLSGDGLGNPHQQGLRSIAATPYGLAIGGTHFPLGYAGEVFGCDVSLGAPQADSLAPTSMLTSPPSPNEGATLAVRNVSFAWSATDDPAPGSLPLTYAYRLDPQEPAFSAFGAATGISYSNLANGTYTFHVIARDSAGNIEAPGAAAGAGNRRTFTVNAADLPPTVSITVGPADPNTTGNAGFMWSGNDDVTPSANLLYDHWLAPLESDPGTFIAGTSANYNALADGSYTFHVKAKDTAGNVGAEATMSFTVDVPPAPPQAPVPAAATLTGPRVVRVSWANVAGESRFEVQRCGYAGRICSFADVATNVPADATYFDDTVALPNLVGIYNYRVRACNGNGCSAWAPTNAVFVQ